MGTNANGYEIRLTLLQMAKDMAYEKWHAAQNAAFHNASAAQSAVIPVEAPSFAEIEELARKLYGFVKNTGSAGDAMSATHSATAKLKNPSLE